MSALSQGTLEERYPSSVTISRGSSENPVHGAEDRGDAPAFGFGIYHYPRDVEKMRKP
jgi:hypothetical protein